MGSFRRALASFVLAAPAAALLIHCDDFSASSAPSEDGGAAVETGPGDGEPTTPPDGATPLDASSGCRPPAAPTRACFTTGACSFETVSVKSVYDGGGLDLAYPHDPVRWKDHLFFAVQENTVSGRNAVGAGYIFRVDLPGMANLTRVTTRLEAPAALFVHGDHLYWRNAGPGAVSTIERIDLTKSLGVVCGDSPACKRELVATMQGAWIEQLHVSSPTLVHFKFGTDQLYTTAVNVAGWGVPYGPRVPPLPRGSHLASGVWSAQAESGESYMFDLGGETPLLTASWADASAASIATSCGAAFLFDDDNPTPAASPFNRIHRAAGGADGGLTPLSCNGCASPLAFGHSIDSAFAYVASPNGGNVRAIPLGGGNAVTLATGDIWDVINDDDAVYFTNVNGNAVGRIAKH